MVFARRLMGGFFIPSSGFRFLVGCIVWPVYKDKNRGWNFPHLRKDFCSF
jgi:hypothetical protein